MTTISVVPGRISGKHCRWLTSFQRSTLEADVSDSKRAVKQLRSSQQSSAVSLNFIRVLISDQRAISTFLDNPWHTKDLSGLWAVLNRTYSMIAREKAIGQMELQLFQEVYLRTRFDAQARPSLGMVVGDSAHLEATKERQAVEATDQSAVVLEKLDGFVERIDGDVAFVVFTSQNGQKLSGQCPANEMLESNIEEGQRFVCRTIQNGKDVRVEIEPIPLAEITAQEWRAVCTSVESIFLDDEGNDD